MGAMIRMWINIAWLQEIKLKEKNLEKFKLHDTDYSCRIEKPRNEVG